MAKTTNKKIRSAISLAVSIAIFALAIAVFVTAITARARNGRAEFFGYSIAVVATNSMYPEIKAGDLIVVKSCDITEIQEGQNAVFTGLSGKYKGKSIVHRVVEINDVIDEESGEKTGICLKTWGINNGSAENPLYDDDFVYASNFIGREIFHSGFLGSIMTFLQSPVNWAYLLVFLLAIYFAVTRIIKIVKLAKNKNKAESDDSAQSANGGEKSAADAAENAVAEPDNAEPLSENMTDDSNSNAEKQKKA